MPSASLTGVRINDLVPFEDRGRWIAFRAARRRFARWVHAEYNPIRDSRRSTDGSIRCTSRVAEPNEAFRQSAPPVALFFFGPSSAPTRLTAARLGQQRQHRNEEDNVTYLTADGIKKLQEELEHLVSVRRPEIARKIADAKADGRPLRECGLRRSQEHAGIRRRAHPHHQEPPLHRRPHQPERFRRYRVDVGTSVDHPRHRVRRRGDVHHRRARQRWHPQDGRISHRSPIGRALMGHIVAASESRSRRPEAWSVSRSSPSPEPAPSHGRSRAQRTTTGPARQAAALSAAGIDPYPPRLPWERTHTADEAVAQYTAGALQEGNEVVLVGRLMTLRLMGKAAFAHIEDGSGRSRSTYGGTSSARPGTTKSSSR